jgi:hypothetical protein
MVTFVIALFLCTVLLACWSLLPAIARTRAALYIVLSGYAIRLAAASFVHEFAFFSYGSGRGSDANGYEITANIIAKLWSFSGIHYVTSADIPYMVDTTLPANLFAFVQYLNDGPTHLGCTACTAAAGCIVAINIYALAHSLGCQPKIATRLLFAVTFLPTFFFYTTDMYKDGLVTCFVFGVFGSAIRLAHRFSVIHLMVGLISLAALWVSRFYLVFIMVGPFAVGLLGVRARSFTRLAVSVFMLSMAGLALASSSVVPEASDKANAAYMQGTSANALSQNAEGGSGALITGSGPAIFALKLAYSLFAPFPWQSGSLGMQLAKLEMPFWYYFVYRGLICIRSMWARRRGDAILFTFFIVPTILAYTATFSNVGLVVRERLGVVLAMMLLAALSWEVAPEGVSQPVAAPSVPPPRMTLARRSKMHIAE